jgi:uncharacterized protein YlxW (UPF0749 family)
LNLPDQLIAEPETKKDASQVETSLRRLWEKARLVSEMVLRLKTENKELHTRVASLEEQERRLLEELQRRDGELLQIRTHIAEVQVQGQNLFSKEETEKLKIRVQELITKINSRL